MTTAAQPQGNLAPTPEQPEGPLAAAETGGSPPLSPGGAGGLMMAAMKPEAPNIRKLLKIF